MKPQVGIGKKPFYSRFRPSGYVCSESNIWSDSFFANPPLLISTYDAQPTGVSPKIWVIWINAKNLKNINLLDSDDSHQTLPIINLHPVFASKTNNKLGFNGNLLYYNRSSDTADSCHLRLSNFFKTLDLSSCGWWKSYLRIQAVCFNSSSVTCLIGITFATKQCGETDDSSPPGVSNECEPALSWGRGCCRGLWEAVDEIPPEQRWSHRSCALLLHVSLHCTWLKGARDWAHVPPVHAPSCAFITRMLLRTLAEIQTVCQVRVWDGRRGRKQGGREGGIY